MQEPNEEDNNGHAEPENGHVEPENDEDPEKMAAITAELRANFAKLEEEFRNVFDVKMTDFTASVQTERSVEQARRKTDVLRTNKVFRDVARPLGGRWRIVFERVLQKLPPDEIAAGIRTVEQDKPFMRAYRSLSLWKELAGEEFNVRDLLDAFNENGMDDLAQITTDILNADEEALYSVSDSIAAKFGLTGGAAAEAKPLSAATAAAVAAAKAKLNEQKTSTVAGANVATQRSAEPKKKGSQPAPVSLTKIPASEALDDRHILQLAKQIGGDWELFGKSLGNSDAEIKEVMAAEGKTYQGTFKVLYNWRDTVDAESEETVKRLKSALINIDRIDLAMQY